MTQSPAIGQVADSTGLELATRRQPPGVLINVGQPQRPLNISVWGGQTDLAQTLWRVKQDRSDADLRAFVKKVRVYDINDQDEMADWMHREFPGMFYFLANPPRAMTFEQAPLAACSSLETNR